MHAARALVAGNWKMHKTIAESTAFVRELLALEPDFDAIDAVIFPPFTALSAAGEALRGSLLGLGGQTMNDADSGAFTGEISPLMLLDCGAHWVILGIRNAAQAAAKRMRDQSQSARRAAARAHADRCGRRIGGRSRRRAHARSRRPANVGRVRRVTPDDVARCVVAYEPIWAIGTGLSDSPAAANNVMAQIRGSVSDSSARAFSTGQCETRQHRPVRRATAHRRRAGRRREPRAQSFADLIANAR